MLNPRVSHLLTFTAKKVKQVATVFERYAGKRTPEECGPDEFMGAQLRILKALVMFLTAIRDELYGARRID